MNETNLQNRTEIVAKSRDKDGLRKRRGVWHYKLLDELSGRPNGTRKKQTAEKKGGRA